jgi:hypothetical protein
MHAHARHMWHAHAQAHLARVASAAGGERLATAAAAASARLATLAVEPQPLVVAAASVDPPVRGRSGW